MTRGASDLWLDIMLEIPVQRIVLRESPKIDSVHGYFLSRGIYWVMKQMEGYVKALEKSTGPLLTMGEIFEHCALNGYDEK